MAVPRSIRTNGDRIQHRFHQQNFRKRNDEIEIILAGSYQHGTFDAENSDVDLLVQLNNPAYLAMAPRISKKVITSMLKELPHSKIVRVGKHAVTIAIHGRRYQFVPMINDGKKNTSRRETAPLEIFDPKNLPEILKVSIANMTAK
ncbi:nucleotidyltransferase domain-containing protein [Candidatus Methanomethylophilus sp. 1R26]|uniref:nucleotidyltransferase domain-containing protein n=1 Tax=Candidatus Methanomethylophilus sp. 1R26 TaxID=1769296 RepID=UPI0009E75F2D|nr:nucleotidyltransferase domain-containing protein [Candidatus Methanomethylophilus sp. 1R26]